MQRSHPGALLYFCARTLLHLSVSCHPRAGVFFFLFLAAARPVCQPTTNGVGLSRNRQLPGILHR